MPQCPQISVRLLLLLFLAVPAWSQVAPASSGGAAAARSTPAWVEREPVVIAGNWDSMPIFRRRLGGAPVWQEEDYRREHSEETVRKLKDLGVTLVITHFYKGFGLEAEKEHMEDTRKLVALLKGHGIRSGVYIGSTLAFETLLLEKPEAQQWLVPDYLGAPVVYGDQTYRKRVYFMHPGYREYIKNVLRIAVEDFDVDLIHFDNTSMRGESPIFFHPLAIRDFRDFLRGRYPPEVLRNRLGFSDVRFVEPPLYARPPATIRDPLAQEWTDFRCRQMSAFYGEMRDFIRKLNPDVAIDNNPHSGLSGPNTIWEQAVDYPRLLAHTDFIWTEEGDEAAFTQDGILVSKIRTYKMADTLGNRIFTYTSDSTLQMAEAMAYNRGCLGMVGGVFAPDELPEDRRNYIKFFRDHFENYRGFRRVADVAVLRSFASMGFNNESSQESTYLFEQALIQSRTPFSIIFDDNLGALDRYRVLVLADQTCLSDEQNELIEKFVRRGGGLVATGDTSLYTEWYRRRAAFGLADLFPTLAPPFAEPPFRLARPQAARPLESSRKEFGLGRVAYLPRINPAAAKPSGVPMTSEYWRLPLNAEELIQAVRWAAGGKLSLDVQAPPFVTAELVEKEDRLILHLINFNDLKTPLVTGTPVVIRSPRAGQIRSVTILSPDGRAPETVELKSSGEEIYFTVPRLATYDLVVLK